MNTTGQLIKNVIRQRTFVSSIRLCQRSLHTSFVHYNTAPENNFAQLLADKFIEQVKKQRQQHKVEPTRYVQIDSLPPTATMEDIHKIAREAFPQGDKSIVEIAFCRNLYFKFTGRCVVSMNDAEDARRLVDYGDRRALGGKILRMHYMGKNGSDSNTVMSKFRRPELFSTTNSTSAAGRSVVISGLPSYVKREQVQAYLRSQKFFPVEGTPDNITKLEKDYKKSKFLVKFDSESEAWRCVRAFHNARFSLSKQSFKLHLDVAY